jgi:hypothetical protein
VACVTVRAEVPEESNKTMRYSREPGGAVVLVHDKQTLGGVAYRARIQTARVKGPVIRGPAVRIRQVGGKE